MNSHQVKLIDLLHHSFKAKLSKQPQKLSEKHNKLWFILCWGSLVNPEGKCEDYQLNWLFIFIYILNHNHSVTLNTCTQFTLWYLLFHLLPFQLHFVSCLPLNFPRAQPNQCPLLIINPRFAVRRFSFLPGLFNIFWVIFSC